MKKVNLLLILLVIKSVIIAQTPNNTIGPYTNGKELITAMYNKYADGKWYKYFTFSQNMEYYRNDSVIKKDVWHEAAMFPGNLIIKFKTKDAKNGVLFSNFMVHSYQEGKDALAFPMVHDLLLVGLDVYFLKPEITIHLLDSLGYNLSKIREDAFEGRKVYVVGADKGDNESRQFWIDAERLYMHKIIYIRKKQVNEVVFADYVQKKKYWVSPTILFKVNGKLNLIERYYDINFPKSLNQDLFDPKKFNEAKLK